MGKGCSCSLGVADNSVSCPPCDDQPSENQQILEAAVFQVFPKASILAKDAAASASSSQPAETATTKKTEAPAPAAASSSTPANEKPTLHRYFRLRHLGWEHFPTSRWVSELDCRKIYAPPDRPLTEKEKEVQRIEFAKDYARARTERELKFDWTDAYADVIVTMNESGITEANIEVSVAGDRLLNVFFPNRVFKMGTMQSLSLYLAGPVSPMQCSLKLEAERVVITLRKAKPMLWDKLEGKTANASQFYKMTRIWAGRKPEGGLTAWRSVQVDVYVRTSDNCFQTHRNCVHRTAGQEKAGTCVTSARSCTDTTTRRANATSTIRYPETSDTATNKVSQGR